MQKRLKTKETFLAKTDGENLFTDTGTYDDSAENDVRGAMEIWADYAEDGPTFDPAGKYLCGTCVLRQNGDQCSRVVSPISYTIGSCRIYVNGDASNEAPMPQKLTQLDVVYTERPNVKGFGCARCEYGGKAKEADSEGREGWCSLFGVHVEPLACCFKNSGDDDIIAPVKGTQDEQSKSTKGNIKMADQFRKFVQLMKVDEENHMTWGIVTSEVPDKENEICSYTDAKKAYKKWSDDFLEKTTAAGQEPSMGNIRIMHGLQIGGKVIKLEFKDDEKQVWLGTQPANEEVWKLIKGGYITGLSHGGRYIWKKADGDYTRYAPEISEVSYVDNPANGDASFAYVKADGSREIRKFAKGLPTDPVLAQLLKGSEPAIPEEVGSMPTATMPIPEKVTPGVSTCSCACPQCKGSNCGNCAAETKCEASKAAKAAGCSCGCASCKEGKCSGCSADTKCEMCMNAAAKAVKYLVTDNDGKGHLPYTTSSGKPSRKLCGAAWAALFSPGGHRGNPYEGPDKEKAKQKLKQVYSGQGWDTPTEKSTEVADMLKAMLEDRIQCRAYGRLGKGMYTTARFAEILEQCKYLWLELEFERDQEGDESPATDELKEIVSGLLDAFLQYVEEQIEEEREQHGFKVVL